MTPYEPEEQGEQHPPLQEEAAANNKQDEAKKLEHRGGSFSETPASVLEAPAASPLRFYARLRYELERRGVQYEALPRRTREGQAPPCFDRYAVPFDDWLASASLLGATVPYRYDMPGEPNYCWDCTQTFKSRAVAAGVCQFPGIRFEKTRTVVQDDVGKTVELEITGIGRSPVFGISALPAFLSCLMADPPREE